MKEGEAIEVKKAIEQKTSDSSHCKLLKADAILDISILEPTYERPRDKF